jgi:hypothetical protein
MDQKRKKEFRPEFFKNTLKIHIGNNNLSRKEVVDGLKVVVDLKKIDNICQYKSREFWYVAFNDDFKSDDLLGKQIIIKNLKFTFEHAIRQTIFKCFKISWLPPKFNKIQDVGRMLCGIDGKLIRINELRDSDGLKLNVYNISIEYPINHSINFNSITGKKQICGETLFITKYGDPIRCTFCEEFGHKKSICQKYSLKCTECGKRGHDKNQCTMAHKIATDEEIIEIDVDQDDEAQIEVNTQTSKSISLTQQQNSNNQVNKSIETSQLKNKENNKEIKNKCKQNNNVLQLQTSNPKVISANIKRKGTEIESTEKQQDKKTNYQDLENKSNNSSLNNVDLDVELTEEDVNSIAIALSKQLD